MQPLYSFVIPVYNRPQEVRELLESMLSLENAPEYEILIIEDGSSEKADLVCEQFSEKLKIRYFQKEFWSRRFQEFRDAPGRKRLFHHSGFRCDPSARLSSASSLFSANY